jgi:hypothetical protein
MASTKRGLMVTPAMFGLVDVKRALAPPDALARFVGAVGELRASGLTDLVLDCVRVERGVWRREGHLWPEEIQRVAKRAFHRAEVFQAVVVNCGLLLSGQVEKPAVIRFEQDLIDVTQQLMDDVFSDQLWNGPIAEDLAGLSGLSAALAAHRFTSGVDGASKLAWSMRFVVLGTARPFWPYLVTASSRRAMRKQVGRDEPRSPEDLQPDDVAILRACEHGALSAKEVKARSDACGFRMTASHASKRKGDLKRWGLLLGARRFQIASKGQEWLQAVRDGMQPRD